MRRSRAEQKQQTREALVTAALFAFSRDGYHGARLEGIADEAGFSKGAVYSNFGNKAELFLAVMDYNLGVLRGEDWDPLAPAQSNVLADKQEPGGGESVAAEVIQGLGLATLEFIPTAARDDILNDKLRIRIRALLEAYQRIADTHRAPNENLPSESAAQLMLALDQGASVLALSGVAILDASLLRTGLQRLLLDPKGATSSDDPVTLSSDLERVWRLLNDDTSGEVK